MLKRHLLFTFALVIAKASCPHAQLKWLLINCGTRGNPSATFEEHCSDKEIIRSHAGKMSGGCVRLPREGSRTMSLVQASATGWYHGDWTLCTAYSAEKEQRQRMKIVVDVAQLRNHPDEYACRIFFFFPATVGT